MASKRALITGITGQDGSYLAELLLSKDYEVHGIIRRSSSFNTGRLDHLYTDPHDPAGRLFLHYGDLVDSTVVSRIVREVDPRRGLPPGRAVARPSLLRHPRVHGRRHGAGHDPIAGSDPAGGSPARFYQASSSEMFGTNRDVPSNEQSRSLPASPYAAAKVYGYWMAVNYREAYGMFCTTGSCSTTRANDAAKPSSHGRSRGAWSTSSPDARRSSISGSSRASETGATRPTTSRRCG